MLATKDYPVGRGGTKSRYIPLRTAVPAVNVIAYTNTAPTAGKVVVVSGVTYTFASPVAAAGDVLIAVAADDTWTNLVNAINKSGGTEGAGSDYMSAAGAAHPRVRASITVGGNTVTLTARNPGAAGNALALTSDEAQATVIQATFLGGSDAETKLVFGSEVRYPGVAHQFRHRVTAAEVNAGHTLLAAMPGFKYRLTDAYIIAIGGAAGTTATVDILGTSTSSRKLVAFAQASLAQDTVLRAGNTGAAVLADGASFTANDANTALSINKTGGAVDTATHFDVVLTFAIEAA